ncbi:hypothetical protein JTB14_009738 [Gonioctena quinquepunctata]|nr:hypothetical protein JTB14_009738 [Gonioctena quinquepunctata]
MGSLGVYTVVLILAVSLTSALDTFDVIPSCAKALLWGKSDQQYYDESLKSIYENEGVSHAKIMKQIRKKVEEDDDKFDIKPYKKCIDNPNDSTNECFNNYGPCRDTYLPDDYKVYAQYYVTQYPTDGEKGVTEAVNAFKKSCSEDESKPECSDLDQFEKCIKGEIKAE